MGRAPYKHVDMQQSVHISACRIRGVVLHVLRDNFNMWAWLMNDLYKDNMLHFYNVITPTKRDPVDLIRFQIWSNMTNYLVYLDFINGGLDVLTRDNSKSLVQYWIS